MFLVKRYIKTTVIIFTGFIFLLTSVTVFAADYATPHKFKAGDVISAEAFNEIFEVIEKTNKTLTTADIVGTYDVTHYLYVPSACFPLTNVTWDGDNILGVRKDTLTIYDDGDGTYSYQTTNYNSFTLYSSGNPNSPGTRNPLVVKGHVGVMKVNNAFGEGGYTSVLYLISKTSPTQITFTYVGGENEFIHHAVCELKNVSPENPKQLTATVAGQVVTLEWMDKSSNETGFKILRKDSLTGDWSVIATTLDNVIIYTDTLSADGTYWYRVKAANSYGDSVGSNEVKVTVSGS